MGVSVRQQRDGQLHMAVSGDFGFEAARQLLLVTKQCWGAGSHGLMVELEGVANLSSSAVGVLVLLKEMVGKGRFRIRLTRCAEAVHELFESGVLDRYFERGKDLADAAYGLTPSLAEGALSAPVRA